MTFRTSANKCKCGTPALRGKDVCLSCFVKQDEATQRKKPGHEEDDIQEAFFTPARIIFPKLGKLLIAIPNGGKRDKREAARLKKQGVTPGASDILCLVPNDKYNYLCLETKTETGTQSDEQKEFQKQVEAAGGLYLIYRSAAEGIEILKDYLSTSKYK
ncbi:VRR-NUC domain-containing protein [Dysgonomonas sp. Marseille-P4677]|uniref:VRR-NUC domain-containing protein n=1 Tax=Dysgonomonas sp. Marseille-P4677 TaxID=2364790 RepID=UPI001913D75F|nr:VRR-NUC domain-containing protein [Dysgonomonas sp. Marseille-P4677]MBK5719931.1 VRR-NUC domain-containing protein [Dysgonomonas sp. Marseille-P4677]